jgi:hypothetical protein
MRWRRRTAAGGTSANPSLSARTREARVCGLRCFWRREAGKLLCPREGSAAADAVLRAIPALALANALNPTARGSEVE